MARFPHLRSESAFPDPASVDVYKYDNSMDYDRFDNAQMRITLMSVPWDLGEAHVGQRTIEGVGNVVHFGSAEARDAYMDGLPDEETFRFDTKFRRFHSDDYVDVPVPVTSLSEYNYVEILYYPEPGDGPDLEHTREPVERWYYFIRDFERKASNTTRCNIMIDTWQTFVYSIEIPYMFLERGHYPVAESDVDRYLSNPLENSEWLVGEDTSFGDLTRTGETGAVVLNGGDMLAVIVTTGRRDDDAWGTVDGTDWISAAARNNVVSGAPAPTAIAMDAADLQGFLLSIESAAPQFKQTIQGVFFASRDLLTVGDPYTFFGTTCYTIGTTQVENPVIELDRKSFGYPDEYADLAKLYTFPYAALDVYDEKGEAVRVHVEDTTGEISLVTRFSLIWPWISVDGRVMGLGSSERKSVTYYNSLKFSFTFGGRWHEILKRWNVPVYGAIQGGQTYNRFATHWSREQNAYAAQNRRTNENTSASADLANAGTAADTTVANASVQTSANTSVTERGNSASVGDTSDATSLNINNYTASNAFTQGAARVEAESAEQSATVATAGNMAQAAVSGAASIGAASLVGGPVTGAIGAAVGAVAGLVSAGISGATNQANVSIAADLAATKASMMASLSTDQAQAANATSSSRNTRSTAAKSAITGFQNDAISATAANSASATNTTASRTYNARTANATRDYNTAIMANTNQIREASLQAPRIFGTPQSGESGTTRPMALFATVVTQSPGAIAQAGDMFLRYGYRVSRCVNFEDFNVMPKFSFWQCSDLWLKSSTVPDAYMDQIRMLLFGGVTVWRDPADIGHTSIYENV